MTSRLTFAAVIVCGILGASPIRRLSEGFMNMPNCIVCNTPNVESHEVAPNTFQFACPRCGSFFLARAAKDDLPHYLAQAEIRRSLMSHALQRMQRSGNSLIIGHDDLPSFWREPRLPSPQQQADALIRWIGDNQTTAMASATIPVAKLSALLGLPIFEGGDARAFAWLNDQLKAKDLYELLPGGSSSPLAFRLTMKGWELYEKLKRTSTESRTAFMAMKFGEPTLDYVVETCFKPAVARTGFELRKLTDQQPAGIIDNQIRAAIISGRFVVADLTHGNPGAYWEAGFAEGLGLPVIYTCEKAAWKEKKTHFNTNHLVTIIWEESTLAKVQDDLAATIRATFRGEAKQVD